VNGLLFSRNSFIENKFLISPLYHELKIASFVGFAKNSFAQAFPSLQDKREKNNQETLK